METLKIELKETVKREKEIALPCYTKKNNMFYQITSEDKIVRVIPAFLEISKSAGLEFAFGEGYEDITKEEFEEELANVKKELGI